MLYAPFNEVLNLNARRESSMTSRSMVVPSAVGLLTVSAAMWALADSGDFNFPYIQLDHPAIQYDAQTTDDPIARLQRQLDKGETTLEYDPNRLGYLPSLLKHLGVDVDSQMLVFSKSSFQGPKISPRAPRALYFNDNVAVGSVQNGEVIELTSIDPELRSDLLHTRRCKIRETEFHARR